MKNIENAKRCWFHSRFFFLASSFAPTLTSPFFKTSKSELLVVHLFWQGSTNSQFLPLQQTHSRKWKSKGTGPPPVYAPIFHLWVDDVPISTDGWDMDLEPFQTRVHLPHHGMFQGAFFWGVDPQISGWPIPSMGRLYIYLHFSIDFYRKM